MNIRRKCKLRAMSTADKLLASRIDPKECLLVNGFWRSGTTWLQEIIAYAVSAKTVFEPLQVRSGYMYGCLDEMRVQRRDYKYLAAFMPYDDNSFKDKDKLRSLFEKSFYAILDDRYLMRNRKRIKECLYKKTIVKTVRSSLCLKSVFDSFGVQIVHIYRDPLSVISSIIRKPGWGEGAFDNFSLVDHTLNVQDGRKEFFSHWRSDIMEIERLDNTAKLAAFWAFSEMCVLKQSESNAGIEILSYDDLLFSGTKFLEEKLRRSFKREHIRIPQDIFDRPSSTAYSSLSDQGIAPESRGSGRCLSREEVVTIRDIMSRFNLLSRIRT